MKAKKLMKTTGNTVVYKKARKKYLAYTGKINCSYCPYHRRENDGRKENRCWKRYRGVQYKVR